MDVATANAKEFGLRLATYMVAMIDAALAGSRAKENDLLRDSLAPYTKYFAVNLQLPRETKGQKGALDALTLGFQAFHAAGDDIRVQHGATIHAAFKLAFLSAFYARGKNAGMPPHVTVSVLAELDEAAGVLNARDSLNIFLKEPTPEALMKFVDTFGGGTKEGGASPVSQPNTPEKPTSNVCPKCKRTALSFKDHFDESYDRVDRTWTCRTGGCGYTYEMNRVPISEWPEDALQRWYRKASTKRAREELIRCPTCNSESIEAEEAGVKGIGTSSHVWLSCKTKDCSFVKRKVRRSVLETAKVALQYVVLLCVVLVGLWLAKLALANASTPQSTTPVPTSTQSANANGARCRASDLALTMEVAGHLIPGRRGGSAGRYASGRLYQFTLANTSAECTAIVKDIQLAVLDSVKDEHGMQEATTADNQYEVVVSADAVGKRLELTPLRGAPKAQWGYHFTPKSAPDRFSVHVIPREWGNSYVIQFVVTWYDPATKDEMATKSDMFGAFFPEVKGNPIDLLWGSDAPQFRAQQLAAWSDKLGQTVR